MDKEEYWSKFVEDFEERNNYVVGSDDMSIMLQNIAIKKTFHKTCYTRR